MRTYPRASGPTDQFCKRGRLVGLFAPMDVDYLRLVEFIALVVAPASLINPDTASYAENAQRDVRRKELD